jgi:hypothetical protein
MIYIAVVGDDQLVRFKADMVAWRKSVEEGGKDAMTTAWLSNWDGLSTAIGKRTKQDYLVSVFHASGTVYMLGKIRYDGNTLDVSEVVGNPAKASEAEILSDDDVEFFEFLRTHQSEGLRQMYKRRVNMRPLGCLFSWASDNAQKVTLTANTVGLLGYYASFGFEVDPSAPSLKATRALAAIDKLSVLITYLVGIEKGTGAVDEAKAERLGEMFESRKEPAATLVVASKTTLGATDLRKRLEGMIKEQKFAQVDAAMVLGIQGLMLPITYMKGVQWKGDKL